MPKPADLEFILVSVPDTTGYGLKDAINGVVEVVSVVMVVETQLHLNKMLGSNNNSSSGPQTIPVLPTTTCLILPSKWMVEREFFVVVILVTRSLFFQFLNISIVCLITSAGMSWVILNRNSKATVFELGNFQNWQIYRNAICIPIAPYQLLIRDSNGDG